MITLYNADCLEVIPLLEQRFRLVLADLPYGITACDWDKKIDLVKFWEVVKPILTEDGSVVMFGSQPFTTKAIGSNEVMYKYNWVWEKPHGTGHMLTKKKPMLAHEDILVFQNKLWYNPQMRPGKPVKHNTPGYSKLYKNSNKGHNNPTGMKYPKSVLRFSTPSKNKLHPTEKPTALLEYLIKTYSNEEDWVLDPTAGSFSVGVACKNTNRHFVGIEMDSSYYKIGCERLGI